MKWSYSTRQKLKAAGFLLGMMLVTLLTSMSMKRAMQDMDKTLLSVNVDRLQPAVDLVYISENLHAKRLLLKDQLMSEFPTLLPNIRQQLSQNDVAIQDRLVQYEKTKLTESESQWLATFKKDWKQGAQLEKSVLTLIEADRHEAATLLFSQQGHSIFQESVRSLHELARIQSETGGKEVKAAHRLAAGVSLDATLLLAISVIIGLLALTLIQKEKLPIQNTQPFNLN